MFDWGSRRGLAGPLISWRIFNGGRARAEIRAAEAGQQSAAPAYEKAVLTALADAEGELADQHALLAQNKAAATSDLATLFKALGGGWVPRSSPEK